MLRRNEGAGQIKSRLGMRLIIDDGCPLFFFFFYQKRLHWRWIGWEFSLPLLLVLDCQGRVGDEWGQEPNVINAQ